MFDISSQLKLNLTSKRRNKIIPVLCESNIFQEPGESAAVEKTNNLFDAESPMFQKAIYTCLGLVAVLTICGLIWEFAYWRPRQPKEAKTGE